MDIAKDEIPEEPLLLDYMSQMEHDTKYDDSPVGEAGEVFGEYTPFSFITYAEEKENWCSHELTRVINAPVEKVSEFFEEWNNIPPAFDLIDTVCLPAANLLTHTFAVLAAVPALLRHSKVKFWTLEQYCCI